jgi:hypothetical protein
VCVLSEVDGVTVPKTKDDYEFVEGADPVESFETETRSVKFDYNVLATLEEKWGTIDKWQEESISRQVTTVRRTFALLWDVSEETAGLLMLPGMLDEYTTCIGIAWALAHGADPFLSAEALKKLEAERVEKARLVDAAVSVGVDMATPTPD